MNTLKLDKQIYELLNRLGLRNDIRGYDFMVFLMRTYFETDGLIPPLYKLYDSISVKTSVSCKSIDRDIRYFLTSMHNPDAAIYKQIFKTQKITQKHFLYATCHFLKVYGDTLCSE